MFFFGSITFHRHLGGMNFVLCFSPEFVAHSYCLDSGYTIRIVTKDKYFFSFKAASLHSFVTGYKDKAAIFWLPLLSANV